MVKDYGCQHWDIVHHFLFSEIFYIQYSINQINCMTTIAAQVVEYWFDSYMVSRLFESISSQ